MDTFNMTWVSVKRRNTFEDRTADYHLKTQLSCSFKWAIRSSKTVKHLNVTVSNLFSFHNHRFIYLFVCFHRSVWIWKIWIKLWGHGHATILDCHHAWLKRKRSKEKERCIDALPLACLQYSLVMLLFMISKIGRVETEIIKEQITRGVSTCQQNSQTVFQVSNITWQGFLDWLLSIA